MNDIERAALNTLELSKQSEALLGSEAFSTAFDAVVDRAHDLLFSCEEPERRDALYAKVKALREVRAELAAQIDAQHHATVVIEEHANAVQQRQEEAQG